MLGLSLGSDVMSSLPLLDQNSSHSLVELGLDFWFSLILALVRS
jgi:hypothetical protein